MKQHSFFRSYIWAISLICGFSIMAQAEVTFERTEDQLTYFASEKPILSYQINTVQPPEGMDKIYARSGFIHPLYSPSCKVLTDPFPIGHVHQHAVFSAWTRATFKHEVVDFWNQHQGRGTAKHVKLGSVKSDSFEAALQQVSRKGGPAIDEEWKVKIEESDDAYFIDIEIEQSCATENEVYFHPYHYGGFGLRGSAHWSEEDEAHYEGRMKVLTGDGLTSIEESNHTTPRWVAVYGNIDGEMAGFVVMDHASNFRHPQPVRVHPRMPYFVFTPVYKGSFILKPGLSYEAKYRIVTFDGEPDAETIEGWYKTYTGQK